jgi:signal transduction histidine kinase
MPPGAAVRTVDVVPTPQVARDADGVPPEAFQDGPPWRARRRRGPPRGRPMAVLLLAVQLGATWIAGTHRGNTSLDALGVGLLVVASVVPGVAWRHPVPALLTTALATGAYVGLDQPGGPVFLGVLVCIVAAAVRGHHAMVWFAPALGGATALVVARVDAGSWPTWGPVVGIAVAVLGGGLIGELVRERGQRYAEMRRVGQERSRRRASDERLRLAQELHDVLAHDVSLINVQASTALHLFDADPGRARDALAAIKEVSHETLQELRATVSALRREDDAVPLRPAAGLADLDELAARSTAAGLAVEVVRTGDVRALPPRVELAAYRIVQEAVTNARRHSGGRAAKVRLGYGDQDLAVTVTDDGRGRPVGVPDGHGLVGMRERAVALGGELTTGPGPAGGFRVEARIPLQAKGSDA